MKAKELLEWVSKIKHPKGKVEELPSKGNWPDFLYLSPADAGETICADEERMKVILQQVNQGTGYQSSLDDCERLDFVSGDVSSAVYETSSQRNKQRAKVIRHNIDFRVAKWF